MTRRYWNIRSQWDGSAVLSSDKQYRYVLSRIKRTLFSIGDTSVTHADQVNELRTKEFQKALYWIMLNPSAADADFNDATIFRCIRIADNLKYSVIYVYNLFVEIQTNPQILVNLPNWNPYAFDYIEKCFSFAQYNKESRVICAWGECPRMANKRFFTEYMKRANYVRDMADKYKVPAYCLDVTMRTGSPRHPLYFKTDVELYPYNDWTRPNRYYNKYMRLDK
jgi:hypothetical protein